MIMKDCKDPAPEGPALIAPRRGEIYGAEKSEYWNVGIVEYWGRTTTKSLEMRVPQDHFVALNPSFQEALFRLSQ
ncbi:MAG: hypothetical protein CVU64_24045 [Deltaproteobacteria bacterium HGW-Deltaproteobacteria-21]|nr:MAG: hypothetical protein CVU64_24045 [Deltaproteobacteria bacterium HGW-Deltaproteobacteria-21]